MREAAAQVPMPNHCQDPRREEVATVASPCDHPSGRARASFKTISAAVDVAVKLALTQDAPPAVSRKLYGNGERCEGVGGSSPFLFFLRMLPAAA